MTAVVFPFITTCLFIGASLDDKGDFAPACQIQPLPISTDIYDIPNDDGISIYDITVAPHIRYAFAWINDPAAASTICSAWKYFTDYEDVEAANGIPSSFWDEFKKSPLIEIPDLESAWPGSKFRNTANDVTTTITAADVVAESFSKMSLREKAMSDVITNALHSDPADLSWIEHAEQMPDFAATVGAKFIAEPSLIHLPSGVAMLARYTFKDSVQLDLTPFLDITAEEVLQLMKLVTEGAADKKTCHELLLPDMTSLRAVDLKSIAHLGNITSLHLGTTPLIKLTALLKAIAGTSVKEFTHPLLYSRCFELTQGAQFARPERSWAKAFPCGTGTNFPLRQMVYVTSTEQNSSMRRLRSVGLAWSHKAAGSDRSKPLAIALPLEDALLSTSRLVQTIHLMLTKLVTASASDLESCFSASCVGTGIAKRIAIDEDDRVTPIPGMMLATWTKAGMSTAEKLPKAQYLKAGEWSLVLCHERSTKAVNGGYVLRYAFATMDENSKGVTADSDKFFTEVTNESDNAAAIKALSTEWNNLMSGIGICSTEEVLEAMTLALS